jgi:hypothetical protein
MQSNHADVASSFYEVAGNIRTGERTVKALLTGEEGAPDNYKLAYSYGENGSEWATPRHRHVFEQVRHPLEGDYSIGKNKVLRAGWVGYFPESAYYGPQVMSPNLKMVVLQYGGPTGRGFYSIPQRKRAMEELKTKGTFNNGIFSWVDERGAHRNQDAGEAVWEQMFGEKLVYPPSRYEDVIMINPATFDWVKDEDTPGVSRKRLGSFTERDVRIGFIKVDAGASLRIGVERAAEVLFLKEGSVQHDGQTHPRLSAFSTEASDQPETLVALEPTELFYVKLPTF